MVLVQDSVHPQQEPRIHERLIQAQLTGVHKRSKRLVGHVAAPLGNLFLVVKHPRSGGASLPVPSQVFVDYDTV